MDSHKDATEPQVPQVSTSSLCLCSADKEWEDAGASWGSSGAKKAAETPPRSRPPSAGRSGMRHAGSSGSIKSQVPPCLLCLIRNLFFLCEKVVFSPLCMKVWS